MGFIRTLLIQLNWWCSGTRSFPAFFFRKTTLVAESNFLPEAAPIFVILHTFPLLQPMQAEQSSLSKTLKRITGLLKYKKNCKYFIYLSFFLLRLPLSLVTEFCLLGFKWRAKSTRSYSSKPSGLLLCQHTYTHTHTHMNTFCWPFFGFTLGLTSLWMVFGWFYDLLCKIFMLKNDAVFTNASVTYTEAGM